MRRLAAVLFTLLAAGLGYVAWSEGTAAPAQPHPAGPHPEGPLRERTAAAAHAPLGADRRRALDAARASCSAAALDQVVAVLEARTQEEGAAAADWTLLADALLERAQRRTLLRGMRVGEPLFSELPAALLRDLEAGAAALEEGRQRGDDSCASYRIEAALLSQRITGLLAALRYRGDIQRALTEATARDPDDPKLLVALGLRQLLAPKMLGHDPKGALARFEAAHRNGGDERSAVFAAMACWLLEEPEDCRRWLETAVAQNPANPFARAVLARVTSAAADPFGTDVSAEEAAAGRR
ncbi:MAG: hypothetical protein ACON4Z_11380 [Planctomycetota bacterium]